jgi:uracil-DNA glycosylase
MSDRMDDLKVLYDTYAADSRFEHLRTLGRKFIPGKGHLSSPLMLIGEAPGRMENAKGAPFVGRAGENLQNLLEDVKIKWEDIFLTNAVKYWPEGERGEDGKYTYTPTEDEIQASRAYLIKEVEIVQPLIVGLCGRTAIHTMFDELNDVYHQHGELLLGKYVPLYHPMRISYNVSSKATVRMGYTKLAAYLTAKAVA